MEMELNKSVATKIAACTLAFSTLFTSACTALPSSPDISAPTNPALGVASLGVNLYHFSSSQRRIQTVDGEQIGQHECDISASDFQADAPRFLATMRATARAFKHSAEHRGESADANQLVRTMDAVEEMGAGVAEATLVRMAEQYQDIRCG